MTIERLKDLKAEVDVIQADVMCDGEGTGSHRYPSSISVYCDELGKWFTIESIEPSRAMGCGCWDGIEINIKVEED